METPAMKLVCGDYDVEIFTPLQFSKTSLGCSLVSNGSRDLYDLGFKHKELQKHGLKVFVNGFLIVDFPAE